ncbi:hypothetical protein AYL99_05420 [Fonsecaea erecta]|uniref:Xylanolytic transcriptional activator regulatory domain-containing protein n=1 Tax=Fonsecaea erecta TaxID=1367422 RepID=A0A178ZKU5_9EURO|nr:hypothetical protein AYL99_05420 [Fonsecaea erecta]OAP60418.1 hypothetical protein AYL99_05420 [Fonsecaea erecta]
MPSSPKSSSTTTAKTPEYTIDLEQLCRDGDKDVTGTNQNTNLDSGRPPRQSAASAGGRETSLNTDSHTQAECNHPWAESWYLSYVLHTTNNDHPSVHRSLTANSPESCSFDRHQSKARAATLLGSTQSLPAPQLVDAMIKEFFTNFQVFCPLLEEEQIRSDLRKGSLSTTLLRCILFVASIHCEMTLLRDLGYNDRIEAEGSLFENAKAAFDSDVESDSLTLLYCSYLLHYWSGRPRTFKDSLWWLAGAIRCAQSLGMHRTLERAKVSPLQRRLWRKIWWLLYIRDRQISISLGKPFLINDNDCDVEPLQGDELPDRLSESRAYIQEQMKLSIAASSVFTLFSPLPLCRVSRDIYSVHDIARSVCANFRNFDDQINVLMAEQSARKKSLGILLHMTVNYYKILAYRILERNVQAFANEIPIDVSHFTKDILRAAETITSLFEEMLISFKARHFPMICVSAVFAAMTVQLIYSRRSNLRESQHLLDQQLRFNLLGLKEFEETYRLAHWIRELFLRAREKVRTESSSAGTFAEPKILVSGGSPIQTPSTHVQPQLVIETMIPSSGTRFSNSPNSYDPTVDNSQDFTVPQLGNHVGNTTLSGPGALHIPSYDQPELELDFFPNGNPELFQYQTLQVFADEFSSDIFMDPRYTDSFASY